MQRFMRSKSLLRKAIGRAVALASVASVSTSMLAGDWPQWRGPNRDGISAEKGWTTRWPEKGPKVLWKAKVDTGMSSCAIVGNRLYTMGFSTESPARAASSRRTRRAGPGARILSGAWTPTRARWCGSSRIRPLATRRTARRRSATAASIPWPVRRASVPRRRLGRIVWNKNLVKDFGGKRPYYGYACSPLLVRDVLVVECGGKDALVVGLDAKTGQPRWKCGKGEAGFASPVSYEFGGNSGSGRGAVDARDCPGCQRRQRRGTLAIPLERAERGCQPLHDSHRPWGQGVPFRIGERSDGTSSSR